jgi:hypothetical protein
MPESPWRETAVWTFTLTLCGCAFIWEVTDPLDDMMLLGVAAVGLGITALVLIVGAVAESLAEA